MKLVRFGQAGAEKPGILDADGNIRDLSAHVSDINGTTLAAASLDANVVPLISLTCADKSHWRRLALMPYAQ